MNLSENFTLKEFTKSSTATRLGIDNTPTIGALENLSALCYNVLQPLRETVGRIKITSGYRSPELNAAIRGSAKSQHCKGEAADIEAYDYSNLELFNNISDNYDFDQLILEFYEPSDPHSGWVHVSYKATGNRNMKLAAVKENGTTVYKVINSPRDLIALFEEEDDE